MNAFDRALDQFKTDGSFIYQRACLTIDHLSVLQSTLEELDPSNTYQFHLNYVRLDPHTNQQALAPALRRQASRLSRSSSSSSSEGISSSSDLTWAKRIEQFQVCAQQQTDVNLTLSRSEFLKELLNLLKSGLAWSSIKIKRVYFQEGPEQKEYVSADFHRPLFSYLANHPSLTRLSVDPFCLSEGRVTLGLLLTNHAGLKELSLGITKGKFDDWESLGLKLAAHRGLMQTNFKSTVLNNENASGLLTLAANNYQTPMIFPPIADGITLELGLLNEYQALTERLKSTPEERFIQERLSQASILNLATRTLVKIKRVQIPTPGSALHDTAGPKEKLMEGTARVVGELIDATINEAQVAEREIERSRHQDSRDNQEKSALKLFAYLIGERDLDAMRRSTEAVQVLPKVYQDNWEYVEKHRFLFKLNLNYPHPDKEKEQSIARFLLNEVCQTQSAEALQLLLNTEQLNVFEPTKNAQESFLVQLFKNKALGMKPLKQTLLQHIIQDDRAMEIIEKQLETYPKLMGLYQSLISHLDRYAVILKQRGKETLANRLIAILKSGLFFIWKEDTAANRPEEFSAIKYHFEQSIQRITNNGEKRPGHSEFQAARDCFDEIITISEQAKKGRFMASNLYDEVVSLSKQLLKELWVIQAKITEQYKAESEAMREEQTGLKQQHAEKMVEMEAKAATKEAELEAERAERLAKQAELEAERIERAREIAKRDAKEAEREREIAEANRVRTKMEAEIKELRALLLSGSASKQDQALETETEVAGASAAFFSAPR